MDIKPVNQQPVTPLAQQPQPSPKAARDPDHDGDVDGAKGKAALPRGQGSVVDKDA